MNAKACEEHIFRRKPCPIASINNIVFTIRKQVASIFIVSKNRKRTIITIQEPANHRVVVPGLEVVHGDLGIVVIAAIAVGVNGGDIAVGVIECNGANAPCIVGVLCNDRAAGIEDLDDIALQVLPEVEGRTVIDNTADGLLSVVQGNQSVAAPGLLQDVSAIQDVGMLDAVYSLGGSDTVGIVGIGIAAEGLQLPTLLPCQGVAQIIGGVALIYSVYPLFCTVSTNSDYHKSGRSCKRPLEYYIHE